MLILDDLITAPAKGSLWVAKYVYEAYQRELSAEQQRIREQLRELYAKLDNRQISESQFDEQETRLLDRLDRVEQAQKGVVEEEPVESADRQTSIETGTEQR